MKRGLTENHLLEFRVNVCARLQVFLRGKAEVPFVEGELADAKVAKVHRVSAAQLFDASQLRLRGGGWVLPFFYYCCGILPVGNALPHKAGGRGLVESSFDLIPIMSRVKRRGDGRKFL